MFSSHDSLIDSIAQSLSPEGLSRRFDAESETTNTNDRQVAIACMQAMRESDRFNSFNELSKILDKLYESWGERTERSLQGLWDDLKAQDPESYLFAARMTKLGFLNRGYSPVVPTSYYFINERLKTIYCSIPKNACTLFKTMLLENSQHRDEWETSGQSIHDFFNLKARDTSASHLLACLSSAEYFKFAVLRNPLDRAVSGYVDKFAKHVLPEPFVQEIILDVQTLLGVKPNVEKSITFAQFVDYLARTPDDQMNDHWRSQHNFTASVKFDFIGQFEAMQEVVKSLERKLGIRIRKKVSDHATQYQQFNKNDSFHDMYPQNLRALGKMPTSANFFTDELVKKLQRRYKEDVLRYDAQFET